MPNREEIETMFLAFHGRGWVAGAEEVEHDDGMWHIELEDEPWRFDDAYRRGNDWSCGHTKLFYEGELVLFMSYCGFYPKDVRTFLKETLRKQYEGLAFLGGRGPRTHRANGLSYHNVLQASDEFCVTGREEIYRDSDHHLKLNELLGFHEYMVVVFPS